MQGVPAYSFNKDGGKLIWQENEVECNGKKVKTGALGWCVEFAKRYMIMTRGITFEN